MGYNAPMTRGRKEPPEVRFWHFVVRGDNNACWNWIGAINPRRGYGRFNIGGYKTGQAHRFSYQLANGPAPEDKQVCHTCDNRRCVNPKHLFLGTAKENTADMIAKNRMDRGTSRYNAKLNDDDVRAIRKSSLTQIELSRTFQIAGSTISEIKNRKRWRHVVDH